MPIIISQISNLLPNITNLLLAIFVLIKGGKLLELARDLLSDEKLRPSSRRFCAIVSTLAFCHLAFYSCHNQKPFNPLVGWMLMINTFLCLGLATLPEIFQLWGSVRGFLMGNNVPEKKDTLTVNQTSTEVTIK